MLPAELEGPGKEIESESPTAFLRLNRSRYPMLDPDFIVQICFEHPQRFNERLPLFDVDRHSAKRRLRTAAWVYECVRYDDNEKVEFWYEKFDEQLATGRETHWVFTHMIRQSEWPFPPVVIEASFAKSLGAPVNVGRPYHLIEGTHRVSYLRRMVERGLVRPDRELWVIEISGMSG
jgi:hypothetical protein